MIKYTFQRIIASLPTILGVTFLVFSIIYLIPGDPARLLSGPDAPPETIEQVRINLGLDRPFFVRYGIYMGNLVQGDMGVSYWRRSPVIDEVRNRFGATLELAVSSIVLSTIVAIPLGVISALKRNTFADYFSMMGAFLGLSMPVFWLGLLLMLLFSLNLGWLPASGKGEPILVSFAAIFRGEGFSALILSFKHLILPAISLGAFSTALITRMTRSSMLEVLQHEYVRTARAKGLRESKVVYKHALKNCLIPVITVVGMQFGFLLGGAVVTETVFSWPGLGRYIVGAILARDYPSIQGGILVFAIAFVVVNILTDLLYGFVNPRVKYN